METDETFWSCKVNPKFVELIERLVVALEQAEMFTGQVRQGGNNLVQKEMQKGLLTVDEAARCL